MGRLVNITGQRFGRLVVLERSHSLGSVSWKCQCDCGNVRVVDSQNLRRGASKSCGCSYQTHGEAGSNRTVEYQCWNDMIQRCTNPNNGSWKDYGGRGITVCERWRTDYRNFRDDMGPRPEGLTLDRENVNGNYEPSNCRWATDEIQANNKRRGE